MNTHWIAEERALLLFLCCSIFLLPSLLHVTINPTYIKRYSQLSF